VRYSLRSVKAQACRQQGLFILLGQSSNAPNPFGCSFLLIDKRTSPTAKPFYQSIKIELILLPLKMNLFFSIERKNEMTIFTEH
jgi:hypothetical protein